MRTGFSIFLYLWFSPSQSSCVLMRLFAVAMVSAMLDAITLRSFIYHEQHDPAEHILKIHISISRSTKKYCCIFRSIEKIFDWLCCKRIYVIFMPLRIFKCCFFRNFYGFTSRLIAPESPAYIICIIDLLAFRSYSIPYSGLARSSWSGDVN
jgi:hypothetical protein